MAKSYFFHFAPIRGRMVTPTAPQSAHAALPERDAPRGEPSTDSRRERSGQDDARRTDARHGWRDEDERW